MCFSRRGRFAKVPAPTQEESMADQEDHHTLSVQIANQIINTANNRLEEGLDPLDIAAGLRHAAANFTAFTVANADRPDAVDPSFFSDEFMQIYNYYFEKHVEARKPVSGLDALIKQVKDEN